MKNLFEQYEVIPLATTELPGDYQRRALDFFTNPKLAPNPYVDITVQLDISTPSAIALSFKRYYNHQQEYNADNLLLCCLVG